MPEPLKRVLDISSPSQVFAQQVGAPIVGGIMAGIESQAAALNQQLAGLVGVPPVGGGAVAGAGALAGAGTAALPPLTFSNLTVYGPEFLDQLMGRIEAARAGG